MILLFLKQNLIFTKFIILFLFGFLELVKMKAKSLPTQIKNETLKVSVSCQLDKLPLSSR